MEKVGRRAGAIKAVSFDLDGTLYPNYRLYRRLIPFLLIHPFFYTAFNLVRHKLHGPQWAETAPAPGSSFYDEQASLMAAILHQEQKPVREKAERVIYRTWETLFSGVKPFPLVKETLSAFRNAGLRLAVLSDFPPGRKISFLDLDGFFDVVLSTEETGRLKPSCVPFAALVKSLSLEAHEILYVGNSPRYDAAGARLAGMKTALIKRNVFSTGHCPNTGGADFVFRNYRQLREYVLG
jgi:HAD superfamily hydrolase (TIGR01549 family)